MCEINKWGNGHFIEIMNEKWIQRKKNKDKHSAEKKHSFGRNKEALKIEIKREGNKHWQENWR